MTKSTLLWGQSPSVTDILRLAELARQITQADRAVLCLHPGPWSLMAVPLIEQGLNVRSGMATLSVVSADPAEPHACDGPTRYASDVMHVAVPILLPDGLPIGRFELINARQDSLSSQIRAQLRNVAGIAASRLAHPVSEDSDIFTALQSLIDDLADRDTEAGLHLLSGLVRLASGKLPSKAESSRLRLAGLAEAIGGGANPDADNQNLRLTIESREILGRAGLTVTAMPEGLAAAQTATTEDGEAEDDDSDEELSLEFTPFARLTLGSAVYEIGEPPSEDCLAWRTISSDPASPAPWHELSSGLAEGWTEIAAEIVETVADSQQEFVSTHMIHERDHDRPGERQYALYDLIWRMRVVDGVLFARTQPANPGSGQESAWIDTPVSVSDFMNDTRKAAYEVLCAIVPDLDSRIGADVRAWVRRIASGATVAPVLMAMSA